MFVKERFQLSPETVKELKSLTPEFGYNGFGEMLFYRTYSRIRKDGGQEDWADVVVRVIEGVFSIRKDHYARNMIPWKEPYWQDYARDMALSMFNMEWCPPGRGLWAMGTDFVYERGSMALYNCAYTNIGSDMPESFSWMMDSLMHGVGVGFGPLRDDEMVLLPIEGREAFNYVIDDSREAWCDSVAYLIRCFQDESLRIPIFDYSHIRPKGRLIKGFGGIASGPEPLKKLHEEIILSCNRYIYKLIDSVQLKTDIANMIGCCVVAGNVRRSAEIACGPIDDPVFIDLKDYKKFPYRAGHGWMSNNSVILSKSEDFERMDEIARRVIRNGEPGYINACNLPYGRLGKNDTVKHDNAVGFNPCQPAWATVLTPEGVRQFKDVDAGDKIWSESGWTTIVKKWSTGINPVYRYSTVGGVFVGTEEHRVLSFGRKKPVKFAGAIDRCQGPKLQKGEGDSQDYADGVFIMSGVVTSDNETVLVGAKPETISSLGDYVDPYYSSERNRDIKTTIKTLGRKQERRIPEHLMRLKNPCGLLRGIFAQATFTPERVVLIVPNLGLLGDIQTLLSSIGIASSFSKGHLYPYLDTNGHPQTAISGELIITEGRILFGELIYPELESKKPSRSNILDAQQVIQTQFLGKEETFEITVDNETHTYWTGGLNVSNCGEIALESRETCNVVETAPTRCETVDDWYNACCFASFYASTVSLLPTHQPSTNHVVARNRRIGVSIIDVTGWIHEHGMNKVTSWLRIGYKMVKSTNAWANGEAGVPEAIRVTTIKPGGTVPKVLGRTSGMSYPTSHHTLRRVRIQHGSPIYNLLIEAGVPHEPDVVSQNTEVFEFPILQGPARISSEVSIWEQAFLLTMLQREWADNAVSNTLNFKPKWPLVARYFGGKVRELEDGWQIVGSDAQLYFYEYSDNLKIVDNVEDHSIDVHEYDRRHEEDDVEKVLSMIAPLTKSVSLLPFTREGVYKQMPESSISEEEYNNRLAALRPIDWTQFRNSDGQDEMYCTGDNCELPKR